MKTLMRERVVPTLAAKSSWLIGGMTDSNVALLAEVGKQQEEARKPPLARIEQLVDQIRFELNIPRQQESHEHLGKGGLIAEHANHGLLFDFEDRRLRERDGRGHVQWLARQASLAEEVARAQYRDDSFLALLGYHAELDLAALDIEDAIGGIALPKDDLLPLVFLGRSSRPDR